MNLPAERWRAVLDRASPPSYGEVVQVLAESDVIDDDPRELVENALAEGVLGEETPDNGLGRVYLSDGPDDGDERREDGATPEEPAFQTAAELAEDEVDRWGDVEFGRTEGDTWPPELLDREQWMGRAGEDGKLPFAPWADPDHPAAGADEDARWKWGLSENYTDGETVGLAEDDPRLDGRVFIQLDDDPFAFVDGDDVRDPETGEVHPAFVAILEHLGVTYADVSSSGAGVHAYYKGELPIDGKGQAAFDLDTEPWGSNDAAPSVEFYANKHVNVATGERVVGTPLDVREWNTDALRAILRANGYEDKKTTHDTDRPRGELDGYDPTATRSSESTDEIRDVFSAINRLEPGDVHLSTSRTGEDSTGWSTWDPEYRSSESGESLHYNGEGIFYDHKEGEQFGVLGLLAAERGIISNPWDRLAGREWWAAIKAARNDGAEIPQYEGGSEDEEPVAALPLERLQALEPDEARRYARAQGIEWPSTADARDRLRDRIMQGMKAGETVVLDAPTALGKSHTVATEPWLRRSTITDDKPVVQFHATREARDQAAEASEASDATHARLRGRREACAVARGDHDPDDENPADEVITVGGTPASEWLDAMCEGRGVPFSVAHTYLEAHNDQGAVLPCCRTPDGEEIDCDAFAQWTGLPRGESSGDPTVDVIHATHQFAYVPSLRMSTHAVFDERPDFTTGLSTDRIQRIVAGFLKAVNAPATTWERFVNLATFDPDQFDAVAAEVAETRDRLEDALDRDPDREWYLEAEAAHTLAPALARALFYALGSEADANGRRQATVPHEPPRLDRGANEDDGWNRTWVSIVIDEDNRVRTVRNAPDLMPTASVVGLDAHPSAILWQRNVHPDLQVDPVLDPEERRRWRVFERGLTVVQVGDATRPLSSGRYFDEDGTSAMLDALRDAYGDDFGTCITAGAVEGRTADLMADGGIDDPRTMHFGEEKSRNDFAEETVGLVNGCIDPGDDYVLDLLAEAGLDARPETVDVDGEAKRARGRGFVGEDAGAAAAILASVRENHVAQAAGRYARDADDGRDRAVVFVRTDALPPGYADIQVPGVEWVATDTQAAIVRELASRPSATVRELADATGTTKEHVRTTLRRLLEDGSVSCRERAGENGGDVYRALAGEPVSVVDLGDIEIANDAVLDSYTYSLAIQRPAARGAALNGGDAGAGYTRDDVTPGSQSALKDYPPG